MILKAALPLSCYIAISTGGFQHCQGKGLEIKCLCHGPEETHITSACISLCLVTWPQLTERELGSVNLLCVQEGEKSWAWVSTAFVYYTQEASAYGQSGIHATVRV